jgi:hypothetical protein
MSAKKTTTIPAAKIALYDKLLASKPGIDRKGATIPYTSTNGKMFTYLSPSGDLRLRLPEEERVAFMKKYRTEPVVQSGVVMKDWVAVPAPLFARVAELRPYLEKSGAYAVRLGTKSATGEGPVRRTASRAPARRSTSSPSRTAATGSRPRA